MTGPRVGAGREAPVMGDLPPEARRVVEAWTQPGPNPEYHRQAQEFLRARWPVLAAALDALAQAPIAR